MDLSWQEIVLAIVGLLEVIVRLTPTEKDNSILSKIVWVINKIIPNNGHHGKKH